jgi:long-chain acyl-CoA synthetase
MSLTLNDLFEQVLTRHADSVGFTYKAGGEWRPIRYREMHERVVALASGWIELGVQTGDRIAQISENRPEWIQTDLSIHRVGGIHVPVYQTLTAPQIRDILLDCQPRIVVASNQGFLNRVLEACEGLDFVEHVLVVDADTMQGELPPRVRRHADVVSMGRAASEGRREEIAGRMKALGGHDVASIIYTSGTTGKPKGAMLTHSNFTTNATACRELIGITHEHSCLSFLPLSHVFERTAHYVFLSAGATIHYAESIDAVGANLLEVQPVFIASVPRVFEKLRTRIMGSVADAPFLRRFLFDWALRVGADVVDRRMVGATVGPLLAAEYALADRLVYSKVRARVGGTAAPRTAA